MCTWFMHHAHIRKHVYSYIYTHLYVPNHKQISRMKSEPQSQSKYNEVEGEIIPSEHPGWPHPTTTTSVFLNENTTALL